MKPHVIEALDVRHIVLSDREAELRLVNLYPCGAELVQQRQRLADAVAPTAVPQLDGDAMSGESPQQVRQVIARRGCVFEARRKLREERAEFSAPRERLHAAPELVEVRLVGPREHVQDIARRLEGAGRQGPFESLLEHSRVGEFLIQLDREFETARRATCPAAAHVFAWLTVKRGVHFDGVEVFSVVRELVEALRPLARQRIEHAVPGASARRIIPARSANSDVRHFYCSAPPSSRRRGPAPRALISKLAVARLKALRAAPPP